MENKEYYLIEKQKSIEGGILFWRPVSNGYTADFNQAGLYNYEEAKEYLNQENLEIAETFAIEKEEFESKMKTIKLVYNYSDFYIDYMIGE